MVFLPHIAIIGMCPRDTHLMGMHLHFHINTARMQVIIPEKGPYCKAEIEMTRWQNAITRYLRASRHSGRQDLNLRPLDPQSSALAKLRHAPQYGILPPLETNDKCFLGEDADYLPLRHPESSTGPVRLNGGFLRTRIGKTQEKV